MKKIILGLLVFGFVFCLMRTVNAQTVQGNWSSVGTPPGQVAGFSTILSLALNSNDVPHIAFFDFQNPNGRLRIMKFDGTNWVNVGNAFSFSVADVEEEALGFDSNNVPYIAYTEYFGYIAKVSVKKFDTTSNSWVYVGTPGFSVESAGAPYLTFGPNGVPFVGFNGMTNNATVMKFNGTAWVYVGNPGFSTLTLTSLAVGSDNVPLVSLADNDTSVSVMKFNGTAWVYVGNPGFTAVQSESVSLSLSPNNTPFVAFINSLSSMSVVKYDSPSNSWVYVGNPGFSNTVSAFFHLDISSTGLPYVAYRESVGISTMKFNGTAWVYVGNPGFTGVVGTFSGLALDSNNVPYISYTDNSNNYYATVARYYPSLTVTYPNGGQTFYAGNQIPVTWTSTGIEANEQVFISMVRSDNFVATLIMNPVILNDWSETVTIPSNFTQPGQYKICISRPGGMGVLGVEDCSDNYFTVQVPSLTILSPNGGEVFTGLHFTATWNSSGFLPTDTLSFDLVNSATNIHYSIATQTPNDGTEYLAIPLAMQGTVGQYKLYGKFNNSSVEDYSDDSFLVLLLNDDL